MDKYGFTDLVDIIATLRGENGCSWDKEQTPTSLLPNILEETYELVDAIKSKEKEDIQEELGDVLLQVVMQSQMAQEAGDFTMEDVIDGIAKKLVYRHPHVFKTPDEGMGTEEVLLNWEVLKAKEKKYTSITESLDAIAKALPALIRAEKVSKKMTKIGFGEITLNPLIDKVKEELLEVEEAIQDGKMDQLEEEIGDLLFTVVNLSCFFQLNSEFALTKSTEKFINRFRYIENLAFAKGKALSELTAEEIDHLWKECKRVECKG